MWTHSGLDPVPLLFCGSTSMDKLIAYYPIAIPKRIFYIQCRPLLITQSINTARHGDLFCKEGPEINKVRMSPPSRRD